MVITLSLCPQARADDGSKASAGDWSDAMCGRDCFIMVGNGK